MSIKRIFLHLLLALSYSTIIYAGSNKEISIPLDAPDSYLACYALNPTLKSECINKLNSQYIPKHNQKDSEFIKEFQYEAEKQGFKKFLNNLNLVCEKVNDGPVFIEQEKAYLVKCEPDHQYLMSFNYEGKIWTFIKEK